MEKKLMRVTLKLNPAVYDAATVGRAQVLVNKSTSLFEQNMIKRKVRNILATLGNVRYEEKYDKVGVESKADTLLDIAVKGIVELEGMDMDYKIVHLEVKIKDLEFYDYLELLE